jgi:hypothetical protein
MTFSRLPSASVSRRALTYTTNVCSQATPTWLVIQPFGVAA